MSPPRMRGPSFIRRRRVRIQSFSRQAKHRSLDPRFREDDTRGRWPGAPNLFSARLISGC